MSDIPTSMQGLHDAIFGNVNNALQGKDYIRVIWGNVINVFGVGYIYDTYYLITNTLKPTLEDVTEGDNLNDAFAKVEGAITNISYDTLESYKTQLRGIRQILNALVSCQSTIDSTFLNTIVSIYNGVNDNDYGSIYIGKIIKNALDKLPTTTYNNQLFAIKMKLDEFHRLIDYPSPHTRDNNIRGFMDAIPLYINATSTNNINNIHIFLVGCRNIMAKVIACDHPAAPPTGCPPPPICPPPICPPPPPPPECPPPICPPPPPPTECPPPPPPTECPPPPPASQPQPFDNFALYTSGDTIEWSDGKVYRMKEAVGAAGYNPDNAPDNWEVVSSGGARKSMSRKAKGRKTKSRKTKSRKTKARKTRR